MNDSADRPDLDHLRPEGVDDGTVAAVGKLSEALEFVERARGHLYEFHQLIGHADLLLGDAVDMLTAGGHTDEATRLEREVLGRNVITGRWTFQVVEDFDDNYWSVFRSEERRVRDALQEGKRHVFEAEMKERRRTHGAPGPSARP
ncbi:hypothetical protein Q8814_10495 [Rhodococcus sp. CC-R104]|uniref:Uncharacterized protein n=1 Tax=Rhodococcus chondri TaxID=3065941 RepID=A0ABU7JR89_9NOCA|nr:hypothetical protein [Rhodococcus sp. CC-R104]MEE2032535.1 hypothetical protein [Rhodococcus sp. CC-R104]